MTRPGCDGLRLMSPKIGIHVTSGQPASSCDEDDDKKKDDGLTVGEMRMREEVEAMLGNMDCRDSSSSSS